MWATLIRLSWLNLLRNSRRSAVTAAIAALGAAGMLLAGGFALYTYESLAQAAARSSGHVVVATASQFAQDEEMPLQHGLQDWRALKTRLLADDAVRHVLPRIEFNGLVGNGDKSTVMMAVGIDPDAEFAVKGPFLKMAAGRVLDSASRGEVMLGEGLARSLQATPGRTLTLLATTTEGALNATDVTVAGVFSTGTPELDKRLLYTDLETAQKLLTSTRVSSLGVFLDRMESTQPAQGRLGASLPELQTRTWRDLAAYYGSVRGLYNRIFGSLGTILALIVAFVVANAMAMAVIERTREVGTLRAMGTSPRRLIAGFLVEGAMLGGGGAALGAALAAAVSAALLVFPVEMPPPPGSTQGYPLQVTVDPWLTFGVIAALLVVTALATGLVARQTVRRPIVEALAHT
jgi:putative ABC transport system permease protein